MKLTVIVCTYNYAPLLADALRTLVAQTFPYFELLIVDDGSTDNTEEVVRQFQNQFHKYVYLKKPHTGLADSRNVGIEAAKGSHIAFLDADDLWAPEYLQKMKTVFELQPEADLVCCDGFRIYASGEIFGTLFPAGLPPLCGRPLSTAEELFSFFPYVAPSALVFAKTLFEQIGPFDGRYPVGAEDWHWVIRAVSSGAICFRLDRKLMLYRRHDASLTSNVDKMFEGWIAIYADTLRGSRFEPAARNYARNMAHGWSRGLLWRYPAARNRQLLRQALQAHGSDWLLESAWLLTFLGLCQLARAARQVKQIVRKFLPPPPVTRVDLQAEPESIFATLAGQSEKAKAIGGR